jgi:hypothetical protein
MYFLLGSELRRSIPFVFLITAAVAALSGVLGPGMLITIPIANIVACTLSYRRHNAVKRRRRRGLCIACEYDLTGLSSPQCPECGTHQRVATRTVRPPAPSAHAAAGASDAP